MSYGQTKVSEYFSKRKNCDGFQPSKLRKVMVDEDPGAKAVTTFRTPPIGSRTRARVSKVAHTVASPAQTTKKSTRSRKCKVAVKPANQQTLEFTLKKAQEKAESVNVNDKSTEAIPTAVCDNHNASPPGSPTKRLIHRCQDEVQQVSKKRGRREDAVRKDLFQEEVTEGFSFKKVEIKEDRPVLSPRRQSSDSEDSSPVFEFRGKEKAAMKEAKLKELVRDFTAASDNICKARTSSSVLEQGESSRKQDQLAAPDKGQVKGVDKPAMPLEELKKKAALSMKNPALLKAKLSKCSNLNELKERLKQLQPASPQKKVQQPVSVQSPAKSHLTEAAREAVAKMSSPSKVRKPAYEKFAALQEEIPPGLTLPKAYKLLLDMFVGMDTVVSILHKRAEVCTFSKLKAAIQQMTRRNFELKHLGQIKAVYPTAYHIKQEKNLPCYGKKRTSEYQLTVEANLVDDPLIKDNKLTILTKDGRPDFTTARIVERKSTFHRKLIDIMHRYHKVFLSSLKPPMSIPEHKVTHWHPKFCVENVPEIEPAELPQAENVSVITSAKDALEHVKKFSNNARIKQALEKVAAENEKNDAQNRIVNKRADNNSKDQTDVKVGSSKHNTNMPSKSNEKQALKGVSQSFLEKIRAKEARKQQEAMLRSPADEKKQERMSRLPELVRILRTLFVTSKKSAMLKADVLEKLADSYKACMGEVEAECHLDLLTELVPDWISVLKVKRGVFISLDKNKDINTVIATLNKMRKEMP